MHLFRVRSLLLVTFAAAVVAAGCGDAALSSPTAPSALPEASAPGIEVPSDALASTTDEFVALGGGKGHGGGGANSGGGKHGDDRQRPEKGKSDRGRGGEGSADVGDDDEDEGEEDEDGEDHNGRRRNLSGFVTAVGADSITIRGIVVKITPATVIRHGHRRLTLAQIAVGDHAQAKGSMGDDGTMTATEVKVEDTGRDNEDAEAEAEATGAVSELSGTCPSVTFTLGTTVVKTDATTEFEEGACAAIANGTTLEVKGMTQTDGSILARELEFDLDELDD